MFRILFLLLVVMSSAAFAQTEEKPKAVKFAVFEIATDGDVKREMQDFFVELGKDPLAQGYILNYGTANEIGFRERQITKATNIFRFDSSRITIVRGGFWKNIKSELWIVPSGAENPLPTSNAEKIDEFGKITNEDISARLDSFHISLGKNPNSKGYILNFGAEKVILALEKHIKKLIAFRKYDLSRIIFKKAGSADFGRTQFWIISPDSENKKPLK